MVKGGNSLKDEFLIFKLFFELKQLEQNLENWKEENLKDNPPRFYRFMMIKSILNYYNISLNDFINGDFLNQFKDENRQIINDKLIGFDNLNEFLIDCDIQFLYKKLFEFRLKLESVFNFNSGLLAIFESRILPIKLIENTIEIFKDETEIIDEILCSLLLSAKNEHRIDMIKLISEFNFPMVNLDEIDADWI